MIGFFHAGRMGNYLFEAATAIGLALKNGVEFSVPNRTHDNFHCPIYLQHLINPNFVQGRADIIIEEKNFHYDPIEYKKEWDGLQVMIRGYWQSPLYFQDYREQILRLFNYRYHKSCDWVSVHVRRGDYVNLRNKHPEVTLEWYEEAMAMFPGSNFLFLSDDIQYCIDNFSHRSDCFFRRVGDIEQDLIDGSCCEHNIISASTYGWWMGWLNRNPDKKVVLPKLWFQPGWDNADTSTIIPPEWIKL